MTLLPLCEGVMGIQSLAFFLIYTQKFKISLLNYSMIETVIAMLCCLNPLLGHLSDKYSLCGSKKKSYLVLCSLVCTAGYIVCALCGVLNLRVGAVLALEIITHLSNSFRNLLIDSLCVILHNIQKFTEAPHNHKSSTSSVVKLFGNRIVGKIVMTLIIGFFYDQFEELSIFISLLVVRLVLAYRSRFSTVLD